MANMLLFYVFVLKKLGYVSWGPQLGTTLSRIAWGPQEGTTLPRTACGPQEGTTLSRTAWGSQEGTTLPRNACGSVQYLQAGSSKSDKPQQNARRSVTHNKRPGGGGIFRRGPTPMEGGG
jgi:hypothetical protein